MPMGAIALLSPGQLKVGPIKDAKDARSVIQVRNSENAGV